jgi:hypothetical protein
MLSEMFYIQKNPSLYDDVSGHHKTICHHLCHGVCGDEAGKHSQVHDSAHDRELLSYSVGPSLV